MEKMKSLIYEALGAASMAWKPRPGDAVFDSEYATEVGEKLIKDLHDDKIQRALDPNNTDEFIDALHINTTIRFGLWDRIKLLFRGHASVSTVVKTRDIMPAHQVSSTTFVPDAFSGFLKKKRGVGYVWFKDAITTAVVKESDFTIEEMCHREEDVEMDYQASQEIVDLRRRIITEMFIEGEARVTSEDEELLALDSLHEFATYENAMNRKNLFDSITGLTYAENKSADAIIEDVAMNSNGRISEEAMVNFKREYHEYIDINAKIKQYQNKYIVGIDPYDIDKKDNLSVQMVKFVPDANGKFFQGNVRGNLEWANPPAKTSMIATCSSCGYDGYLPVTDFCPQCNGRLED